MHGNNNNNNNNNNKKIMKFYRIIWLFLTLLCSTRAFGSIDSPEGVSIKWIQIVPDPARIPNHNRFKLFYDILVEEERHSLALLRWRNATEYHPTRCNLTIETRNLTGKSSQQICQIYPPPSDDSKWTFPETVNFLNHERVLLSWREEHKTEGLRMTSQVIFTDTCQTSDYISVDTYISLSLSIHMVIKHKNTFDIVFSNPRICSISYYCKLTFNHDGKQLNRIAESLSAPIQQENESVTIVHSYAMNYQSMDGMVLVANRENALQMPEIYSPIIGWTSAQGLFYKNHWYSNSSGMATFCWQLYKSTEFRCKWLDGTHENQQLNLNMKRQYIRISGIYNQADGKILLLLPGYDDGTKFFVDEAQTDGKCKRLAEISYNHGLLKRVDMSIVDRKRACFSFVTKKTVNGNSNDYPMTDVYQFTTKCIPNLYDSKREIITCGQGYL